MKRFPVDLSYQEKTLGTERNHQCVGWDVWIRQKLFQFQTEKEGCLPNICAKAFSNFPFLTNNYSFSSIKPVSRFSAIILLSVGGHRIDFSHDANVPENELPFQILLNKTKVIRIGISKDMQQGPSSIYRYFLVKVPNSKFKCSWQQTSGGTKSWQAWAK